MPSSMEDILANYKPEEQDTTEGNSEPEVATPEESGASDSAVEYTDEKPVEDKKGEQTVTSKEVKPEENTEIPQGEEQKGEKANLSRSKKRDYAIMKWKKQFREMKAQRDAIAADFEKYRNLNPENMKPQQAYDYMAWRASAGQRLQDMDADLRAMAQQRRDEDFDDKVNQFFDTPESRAAFDESHEELKEAFEYACNRFDPDGIIDSYLEDSKFEGPMRQVIYNNDALQRELFKVYNNKAIGNAKRLQLMEGLEAEVRSYYEKKAQAPVNNTAPQAKPNVQPQPRKVAKWHLPPRNSLGQFTTEQSKPAPAKKPAVTGRIATGGDNSTPDLSSQVSNLYKSLFGAK